MLLSQKVIAGNRSSGSTNGCGGPHGSLQSLIIQTVITLRLPQIPRAVPPFVLLVTPMGAEHIPAPQKSRVLLGKQLMISWKSK